MLGDVLMFNELHIPFFPKTTKNKRAFIYRSELKSHGNSKVLRG